MACWAEAWASEWKQRGNARQARLEAGNVAKQRRGFRFLPRPLPCFLKSTFCRMKLRVLIVETVSFPVSFPLVSCFHAMGVAVETSVMLCR
jgi:hypothetical protein